MSEVKQAARVAVWDPVVRYGHWDLVLAFAIAYLSAEEESGGTDVLHVWDAVGIIVVLRVLWGFVGPRYARFSDFAHGPVTAFRYLLDLTRGHARRYLGHSPAGGAMVIVLLIFLAATVGTGLIAYGERGKGPLADAGRVTIAVAGAEDENTQQRHSEARGNGTESVIGELHGTLANVTLALVILHIIGVGLASVVHRENLLASMFSGQKRAGD
jgi:cytochrome b